MFAFVALGESYFASGALAGLYTAVIVAIVCVLLGDKSTTVYAPRITSTFFLGLLIYGLVHSEIPAIKSGGTSLILAITFSIILLGGVFEALFGLIRLGSLIKFAPQPVMAGFQNTAAILLFLVQLGNVCGFDNSVPFTQLDVARTQTAGARPTCHHWHRSRYGALLSPPVRWSWGASWAGDRQRAPSRDRPHYTSLFL